MESSLTFLKALYRLIDLILVFPAIAISYYLRFGVPLSLTPPLKILVLFAALSWIGSASFFRLYKQGWNPTIRNKALKIVKVGVLFGLLIWTGAFVVKDIPYSRIHLLLFALTLSSMVLLNHIILDFLIGLLRHRDSHTFPVLVVGAGHLGKKVREELSLYKELGRKFVGFVDHEMTGDSILGKVEDVPDLIVEHRIQEIIIALPLKDNERIKAIMQMAEDMGIRVHFTIDFSRWYDVPVSINHIGTLPLLTLRRLPLDSIYSRVVKRVFDFTLASLGVIAISPILIVLAALVKISSKGPVLFTQTRTGYAGRDFECYKFRSMRLKECEGAESDEQREARKTAIGSFMRKTNLDELPQLFNVILGQMSLVGPRPHMLADTDLFRAQVSDYMRRHFVKPGITGWAQVHGFRGHVSEHSHIQNRVEYDLYYMENWSVFLDISILFKTVFSRQSRLNAF